MLVLSPFESLWPPLRNCLPRRMWVLTWAAAAPAVSKVQSFIQPLLYLEPSGMGLPRQHGAAIHTGRPRGMALCTPSDADAAATQRLRDCAVARIV